MPVAPPLLRRLGGPTLAVLTLSLLLVGCGHRDPSHYDGTVQRNYVQGCQVVLAGGTDNADNRAVSSVIDKDPQKAAHQQLCQCIYTAVSNKDGIPFKDFKSLQDEVRNRKSLASIASSDPNPDLKKYAQQLRDISDRCASSAPAAPTNGGGVVS